MYQPLADRLRPATLEEVAGQSHLLSKNAILRRMIENGNISNMIFYGPSGIGKTTVAGIIANATERTLYRLNATTASISDIKAICDEVGAFSSQKGILIYLDEIQYFNKKQQQSLLEFIENGSIVLIASTTENPYFYVYGAILSRSTVFEFKPVSAADIMPVLKRAITFAAGEHGVTLNADDEILSLIASSCGGDVRKAINAVEMIINAIPSGKKEYTFTKEDTSVSQRSSMRYDRDGDSHYDILSALQKSVRGSDPSAALYYLARLLTAGDLPSACRRMLVIAAEDIGLAYPQAISIVKACVDSALQLGLPEAQLPLAEAIVLLATAPKSNSAALGIWSAMGDIEKGAVYDMPAHIKDAHYSGAAKLRRGEDYKYPHAFENAWVDQSYLPNELRERVYYEYGKNKTEQAAKKYWDEIKKK